MCIRDRNEYGVGAWSDETTLTADSMKPETPEPPSYIVNLWEQVITVNLTAPRDNGKPITEYQIQGRFDAPIGQTSLGDDLQYDYQVKPEDTPPYEFRARAFNEHGWSEWSAFSRVQVSLSTSDTRPAAPTLLAASAIGMDTVYARWEPIASGPNGIPGLSLIHI